jgi:hypothetical protein
MPTSRQSRRQAYLLAALLLVSPPVIGGDTDEPGEADDRTLNPRALSPAITGFFRQVVCSKCDGDGKLTKQVKTRTKDKDGITWLRTDIEDHPCDRCGGDGEKLGKNVMVTAERFVTTLATIDLADATADARLEAARDKLEAMQCVLSRTHTDFFNEHSSRDLNQPEPPIGAIVIFNGVYEIGNATHRRVKCSWANFHLQFEDLVIHDATDGQKVFAGGIFQGFKSKDNGVRIAILSDGFIVRAAPDCGK